MAPFAARFREVLGQFSHAGAGLWALAVPVAVRDRRSATRIAWAGLTLSAVALASATALAALALLAAALAALYWIATRVLGIGVQIDPTKLN